MIFLFMKQRLIGGLVLMSAISGVLAQTSPIFENKSDLDMSAMGGPLYPPQVDATAFVNQAVFNIVSLDPFDTQNTLYFTNKTSGYMGGFPGFRFDFVTNNSPVSSIRLPAAQFYNQGFIYGDTKLLITATNIFSPGPLTVGPQGLLRLEGGKVDISRSIVRAGLHPGADPFYYDPNYGLGRLTGTNTYENPRGVVDEYWGIGINGNLGTNGARLNLPNARTQYFDPPYASSPNHQVLEKSLLSNRIVTNTVSLPSYTFGQYTAYAFSNSLSPNSDMLQVVFIPTNNPLYDLSAISTQVRFNTDSIGLGGAMGAIPIIEFSAPYYDVIDQTNKVNTFYLLDIMATITNLAYAIGEDPDTLKPTGTRRPTVYETSLSEPDEWALAGGSNVAYTNSLLWKPSFATNIVSYFYAGYSASINAYNLLSGTSGTGVDDPTNAPGRVEIYSGTLDLRQARIKAENFLSIKTTNLIGNTLAVVDAPFINYDLGSTNAVLAITNLVAPSYHRLSGQIYAWSAIWSVLEVTAFIDPGTGNTNYFTNAHNFHILMVDSALTSEQPVILNEFTARGSNVVVYDNLYVTKNLMVDADSLRVAAGPGYTASITLPQLGWDAANFPRLRSFTNEGEIYFPGAGNFLLAATANLYGVPTTVELPYRDFINSGSITGATHTIVASNFVNSGTLVAVAGSLDCRLTNGLLDRCYMSAKSDVNLKADNLSAVNSTIDAYGALTLEVTSRLADTGPLANNTWSVSDGFNLAQHPASGDLLGTKITSRAWYNSLVNHTWGGEDRGLSTAGFSNNTALGRLVLDGQDLSLFHFSGVGPSNALYVDYLEFQNYATNVQNALAVDPNLTIYFANANLSPDKLNGALHGRLRWVYGFTGPNSTTNVLVDGQLVPVNIALMQSSVADFDADGIPNKIDTSPFLSGGDLALRVTYARTPALTAQVSWLGIKYSTNRLEYRSNVASAAWFSLTNIVQGAANGRITVLDPVGAGRQKYYRVRVDPFIGLAQP
jgi:hypothetical protein